MRVAITIALILALFCLVALLNVFAYAIKILLRNKGFDASFWRPGIFKDLRSMRELIASESDPKARSQYRKSIYLYYGSILLTFLLFLLLVYVRG